MRKSMMPLMIKAQTELLLRNNFQEIYFRENNLKLYMKIKASLFNILGKKIIIKKSLFYPRNFRCCLTSFFLFKALGSFITIANCCHTQISEEQKSSKNDQKY